MDHKTGPDALLIVLNIELSCCANGLIWEFLTAKPGSLVRIRETFTSEYEQSEDMHTSAGICTSYIPYNEYFDFPFHVDRSQFLKMAVFQNVFYSEGQVFESCIIPCF